MSNDERVVAILRSLANNSDIKDALDKFGLRMFFANNGLHITHNAKEFTKLADSYNRCAIVGLWPGTVDTVSAITDEYAVFIHVTKIGGEDTYSSIIYTDRINKTDQTINNPLNNLSLIKRAMRRLQRFKKLIKKKR